MKQLIVNDKVIELDIGDILKVKDMRKIYPIYEKMHEVGELETMIKLVKALSTDSAKAEALIDDMDMKELEMLSEQVSSVLAIEEKKSESED